MNETIHWELSSVGSERLPYKQRVGGSTPSAPTKRVTEISVTLFFLYIIRCRFFLSDVAIDADTFFFIIFVVLTAYGQKILLEYSKDTAI